MRQSNDAYLRQLLDTLESIGEAHCELYDTAVRDVLSEVLFACFIDGQPDKLDRVPHSFGMFTDEANLQVRKAMLSFFEGVAKEPNILMLSMGNSRLRYIQNPDVLTMSGQPYDEFFGHIDTL